MPRSLALLLSLFILATPAWADPVAPEQAFPVTVRALQSDTLEVVFDLRRGYYLYDSSLGFETASEGITLGTAEIPPGTPYADEFFGQTSIHRGKLNILLPVEAPPGATQLELQIKSQGCWDGGICYPPDSRKLTVSLDPEQRGGGFLDRLLKPGR